MSTESTRPVTDLVNHAAPRAIAASVGKQAAANATVVVHEVRAGEAAARQIMRSTSTEAAGRPAYPYSSFEQAGVRRFDRPAAQPARFRIS